MYALLLVGYLAVFLVRADYAAEVLSDQPSSYYRFDEEPLISDKRMMDLQMDFRTGGIPPPTIDTPSPTACLSTSNSTSAFVNTAGYPNCELSSKLLRSTRIGVAVQLSNAFPLPAATNYPLFNISLLEENSNQQCSIRFAFVMTPSGGIGFASDWTGGTVTNPNSAIFIGPGDRIALTAAPYNYLYRFNTALKVVVRLWYSTSNANLDMNATKGVPWRFWGEAVLQGPLEGCGRLIPAVLNTNFSNSMIQAIYMQKGAQGVEVEPSLGQNLFPNGGADQGEEGSWFVTSTPQPTTSNWTFTVNGASPGKSFQFNFTKVTNAGLGQEQVGLTQISIQPALIPDTTYFIDYYAKASKGGVKIFFETYQSDTTGTYRMDSAGCDLTSANTYFKCSTSINAQLRSSSTFFRLYANAPQSGETLFSFSIDNLTMVRQGLELPRNPFGNLYLAANTELVLANEPLLGVKGLIRDGGNAIRFDSITNAANNLDVHALDMGSIRGIEPRTFEMWFRLHSLLNATVRKKHVLFSHYPHAQYSLYSLVINAVDKSVDFEIKYDFSFKASLPLKHEPEVHYVAVILQAMYEDSSGYYVNATLVLDDTVTNITNSVHQAYYNDNTVANEFIGVEFNSSYLEAANVDIDELAIYDYELPIARCLAHYAAGVPLVNASGLCGSSSAPSSDFVCEPGVGWVAIGKAVVILPTNVSLAATPYIVNGSLLLSSPSSSLSFSSQSMLYVAGNLSLSEGSIVIDGTSPTNSSSSFPIFVEGCVNFTGSSLDLKLPPNYDLSIPYQVASLKCSIGTFAKVTVVNAASLNHKVCNLLPSPRVLHSSVMEIVFLYDECTESAATVFGESVFPLVSMMAVLIFHCFRQMKSS